jgi:hypothetical protein
MANLITSSQCEVWIHPEGDDSNIKRLGIQNMDLEHIALPSLEWCLDSVDQERYPYSKTYEEGKDEEIVVIHTSGTTGL